MNNIQRLKTEEQNRSSDTPWLIILLSIMSFILISTLAFHSNILYLFYGLDGHYMVNLAVEDILWRGIEIGLTNNFLQSLGEAWFPLNTMLDPGYIIATLANINTVSAITAYVIFSFEFFIIALITSRFIGLTWTAALISAWILPLITFPYHSYSIIYPIMILVPHFTTMIVVTNLILILYAQLGKRNLIDSILLSACIIMLVLYIVAISPTMITLCFPLISTISMVYFFSCSSSRERKIKIALSVTMLFLLLASGVTSYIYGLIKFTAAYYFPAQLLNDRMSWPNVSILFHGKGGTWLFVLGFLGAVSFAIFGEDSKKGAARGILVAASAIIGFGILTVNYNFWHGPAPLYFEFFLWPFYVAYAIAFLQLILMFITKMVMSKSYINNPRFFMIDDPRLLFYFMLIIASWLLIIVLPSASEPEQVYPDPPYKSKIVEILNREISLAPGKVFRGRVANFTGRTLNRPVSWFDLVGNDYAISKDSGNDHRMNGLWFYNIPTLDVYSPLISPIYYQFAKYFFTLPDDKQVRNIMTLRNPDVRWLKALGVRYVITDAPMIDAVMKIHMILKNVGSLYLYELLRPNIGQYSPIHIVRLTHTEDILKTLKKETFDPANEIVLNTDLPDKLTQASNVSVFTDKGFLRVKASSDGNSLVLLPLEFSHCLSITLNKHQGQIKLFKANLIQTAIYFHNSLDISIRYFTGPFYHAGCRLEDAEEFEREN